MRKLFIFFLFFLISCSFNYDGKYSKNNFGIANPPTIYKVRKRDTIFSIAWRFGLDRADILKYNNISNPNKIFVGQKLRLKPYYSAKKQPKKSHYKPYNNYAKLGDWSWPMRGRIVKNFNPRSIGANGIRISGKPNQTVNAAAGGIIAYKGNGLNGYGNVVIIKHRHGLLSAYGFLSKTYVKEGQRIKKRQKIGTVGYAANKRIMLHFEIRKNGRPINPKSYIGNSYHF